MTRSGPVATPSKRTSRTIPAPDTPGGLAILGSIVLGAAYVLLFVGEYSALCAQALWIVSLNLLLSVLASLLLVSMIGSDRARATEFELDFARTAQAHLAAGETLSESSPLGGVLSEYARAASEQRRLAREHAYAASPAIYSAGLSLLATLLVGLAYATGGSPDVVGLAMLFELAAFVLLVLTAGSLAFSVGRSSDVPGFDAVVLRRWTAVARPSFPFTHSVSELPWVQNSTLPEPPAPWLESNS